LKPIDEGYIFALAAATLNCFKAGICGTGFVLKSIDVFKAACGAQKQSLSIHAIYGCFLHGVFAMGFAQVKDLIDNVVDVWFMDMADTNKAFPERIAGLYGVLSVFGAMSFLFPCDDLDVFDSATKNKLTIAIKKIIPLNEAPEFCMHSCRLLGLLHMVHLEEHLGRQLCQVTITTFLSRACSEVCINFFWMQANQDHAENFQHLLLRQ